MAAPSKMTKEERASRYVAALARFNQASDWRTLLELAEEFHALDTYRDATSLYDRCVKAASAPAYRDIRAELEAKPDKTAADYREAVRLLTPIQDHADVREYMRVCNVRANVLLYDEAVALATNSAATDEEIGRAVEIFREIKTFRNCRELLERYETYYCERVYAAADELRQHGHVYSEFDEAAELFGRIPQFRDAADLAVACKKRADKLRPRSAKKREEKRATAETAETVSVTETEQVERVSPREASKGKKEKPQKAERVRAQKPRDEETNGFLEVWQTLDKRYLTVCLIWLAVLVAAVVASIWVAKTSNSWVKIYVNQLRAVIVVVAGVAVILGVRCFLRMLTKSMRRKLGRSVAAALQKLASPLVKLAERLLAGIGIDLRRRNRIGGEDERCIIMDTDKPKRTKKRLKNELKWAEQTGNVARVRFLFIDYMILRIRQGYFLRRTMTPAEISEDIALEEDERELFAAYQKARYAGARAEDEISGEAIGRMRALNERLKSKRLKEDETGSGNRR